MTNATFCAFMQSQKGSAGTAGRYVLYSIYMYDTFLLKSVYSAVSFSVICRGSGGPNGLNVGKNQKWWSTAQKSHCCEYIIMHRHTWSERVTYDLCCLSFFPPMLRVTGKEGRWGYYFAHLLNVFMMCVHFSCTPEGAADPMSAMMERIRGGNVHLKKVASVSTMCSSPWVCMYATCDHLFSTLTSQSQLLKRKRMMSCRRWPAFW